MRCARFRMLSTASTGMTRLKRPHAVQVLVGGRPGRSVAATFDGPRELAALMATPCEERGSFCRLAEETLEEELVEVGRR